MKKLTFILLSGALALIWGCSTPSKNAVSIVERNFEQEVPIAGNLGFTFDKDIVPDSMLNIWYLEEYIAFDPPIKGRFMWYAPNELVFSPNTYLQPATNYEGELTDELLKLSKGLELGEGTSFEFNTPGLVLEEATAFWSMSNDNSNDAIVQIDLRFNYKVDPGTIKDKLAAKIEENDANLVASSNEPSELISFYLQGQSAIDENITLNIDIEDGLLPLRGTNPTNAAMNFKVVIPSPYDLSVTDLQPEHDGTEGRLFVSTSQEIWDNNLKEQIEIIPQIDFDVNVIAGGFTIISEDFSISDKYEVTIKDGISGKLGGKMKSPYYEEITFGKLQPSIKFVHRKGVYLGGKGHKNLAVNIINIPEVEVRIYKIYENNIIQTIGGRGNHYYDDYYYDDYYYYDYSDNSGDLIFEQTYTTKDLKRYGSNRLMKLDFKDKVPDYEGFYQIEVRSTEDRWLRAKQFVSVSDIGLIAKAGRESVTVFANSIKTAAPLANVSISFIGNNNQVIKTVPTDNEGVAVLERLDDRTDGFTISLITAKNGKDFNYLSFSQSRVGTSRFEVGGKYTPETGLDAYIYGDRELYRPGETINISAIIRDINWKVPGQIPVKMKLVMPNGKVFKTVKKTLNEQGSFETSIDLPASSQTGGYTAELYSSTDLLLATKRIAVEEFVPDRIKVTVDIDKPELKAKDTLNLDIEAQNLFGPPAADRNYEVEMTVKRIGFYPKKNRNYNYHIEKTNTYFRSDVRQGDTDEEGKAKEQYHIPEEWENMGVLQSDFFVTVFDETGRPVNRKKTAKTFTQDVFYGLGPIDYYIQANRKTQVPLIAVNKDGEALANIQANVQLIKHEYRTVLSRSGQYYRYRSQQEEVVLENKNINISGNKTTFAFTPEISGRYEIRITKPGVNTYVSRSFYCYGWGYTTSNSFQVNNEGHIDITLDKETYQAGQKANVLMTTPFDGKLVVTVESDNVHKRFYLNTKNKSAAWEFPITKEYLPNVYITATLIRPHTESELPLTVAHGFAPLMVNDPGTEIPLSISAVEKSRSKTRQSITVTTAPNAYVTIAAVDEGILQITGYQTPNPHPFFYQKRALEVNAYDLYPYLFPEISSKLTRPGGGGMGMEKRTNPLTNKRIKLVSFWSGIKQADGSGKVTYDIDIPQFSGDLRIMAVAYKNETFNGTHINMKVADPIVISTALPRFLSPKDTVLMPVTLSNTTDKKAKAKVTLSVQGLLKVMGSDDESVEIAPNKESRVVFKVASDAALGQGKVNVVVKALKETFTDETDITVRPASPLQKVSGSGSVAGGKSQSITLDTERFMSSSVDKKMVISNSPMVEFAQDFSYLIGYPHGCVEQTISKAFPQIYFADLAKHLLKEEKGNNSRNPNYNVQEAIKKLQMRQLYNGGLSYWPSGGYVNWWSTAYAAHFLLEAQKAGFKVDQSMMDKLYEYITMRLKNKETIDYYYNRGQNRKIAPREVSYSLYVMALAGKPQISTMNYYKNHTELLTKDAQYMLAASYGLAGDMKKFKQLLPQEFKGNEETDQMFGGSFASAIRDEAIALNVLVEVDPDNSQIGILAKHVSQSLKNRRYLNTQERAWSFLALGKIAKQNVSKDITGVVKVNGKTVGNYQKGELILYTHDLPENEVEITASGNGHLYYFWETEGISVDGSYREEDNYLRVRKDFFDRFGKRLTGNTFTQNDLIVVRISIQSATNQRVDNVVISDILPAGFEIENPRITEVSGTNWIKDRGQYDYQDIRDDRINYFVNVYNYNSKPAYYYYMVRAVSPGVYQMGPVGADAMYNGEYHSYSGGGTVTIKKN